MSKRKVKEGQQFGSVKVLRYVGAEKYECECQQCGTVYLVDSRNIGRDNACKKCYLESIKKDLTGQRFGRLVAKSLTRKMRGKYQRTAWLCDCDCGKQVIVDADSLTSGTTKSCGCISRERDIPEGLKNDYSEGTQLSKIKSIPTRANKTGVVGVNWDKARSRWQASIKFQGKKIYLGRYELFEDAVKARKEGEQKYFGTILESTE